MQTNVDEENDNDEEDIMEDIPLISESLDKNSNLLPDWLYDNDLKDGDTETISAAEEQFWADLIEKYLKPLDMTPKDKVFMIFICLLSHIAIVLCCRKMSKIS